MTFFDVSRGIRLPDIVGGYTQGVDTGMKQGQAMRLRELAKTHGVGLSNMDPASLDAYAREDPTMVGNLRYRQGRDQTMDSRDSRNFNYRAGRDAVSDQRYGETQEYNRGRDAVSDQRYGEEQAYRKGRDAAADARIQHGDDYANEQRIAAGIFSQLDSSRDPASIYPQIRADAIARDPDLAQHMPEEYDPSFVAGMRGFYGIAAPNATKPLSPGGKEAYDRDVLGLDIESDRDGNVVLADGTQTQIASGDMTAGQSKQIMFANRMINASSTLNSLTNEGYDPTNSSDIWLDQSFATRWLRSDQGKRWKSAAGEWIVAKVRPDTGAAITEDEWELYGPIYFPQFGDPQSVIDQKRQAREESLNSMFLTLGVDVYGRPQNGQQPTSTQNATPTVGEVRDGYRFTGGDPADQSNWVEAR